MNANYEALMELRNLRDEVVDAKHEVEMEDDARKKKEKEEEWERKKDEYERKKEGYKPHAVVVKETADVIFAYTTLGVTTFSLHPDIHREQLNNPGVRTTVDDIQDYIESRDGLELLDL